MRWLKVIKRPFRRIAERVIDFWYEITDSFGTGWSVVTAPLRWAHRTVLGVVDLFSRITGDLGSLIPFEFVNRWSITRDYRLLLTAIPAILAGIAVAAGAGLAIFSRTPSGADYFVNRAIMAKRSGQDDVAELFLRKATLTATGSRESRFRQALMLQSVGREADAYAIMQELAPDNVPGFVPAHEWRIQWLRRHMAQQLEKESQSEDALAEREQVARAIEDQLQLILQTDPNHVNANSQLAMISISRKDTQDAVAHVARVVDDQPETRIIYAQLLKEQGRDQDARLQAELAIDYHEKMLQKEGLSDAEKWQHRLRLSGAFSVIERYQDAAEILLVDGKSPDDPAVKRVLSEALYNWSESITATDGRSLMRRLELLGDALKLNQGDERILLRVATIAGEPGDPGTVASATLKDLLSSGQAPPVVHFVLGLNASRQGDMQAAQMHYELAHDASPETPVTLNNLAYTISRSKNPDLQRALSLMDEAIELDDNVPDFFDTRGEILMRMGRWQPAITDLEAALRKLPGRAAIHRKLSVCYAAAGDSELAALHSRRAEISERDAAMKKVNQPPTTENSPPSAPEEPTTDKQKAVAPKKSE